jgi:hypothetical protein
MRRRVTWYKTHHCAQLSAVESVDVGALGSSKCRQAEVPSCWSLRQEMLAEEALIITPDASEGERYFPSMGLFS